MGRPCNNGRGGPSTATDLGPGGTNCGTADTCSLAGPPARGPRARPQHLFASSIDLVMADGKVNLSEMQIFKLCILHIHVLNTSFDFVHEWSTQLTATRFDVFSVSTRKLITRSNSTNFIRLSSDIVELSCLWYACTKRSARLTEIVRSAPAVKFM